MPVLPTSFEKLVLHRFNQGPVPMLDILGGLAFRAVCTALEMDIFEILKQEPLTAAEIADQANADTRGISQLLHVLEALFYLERQGDRFFNTAMTQKWMLQDSPSSVAGSFEYFKVLLEQRLPRMKECLELGHPPIIAWDWFDSHPGSWEAYQDLMVAVARMAGDEITAKTPLPAGAKRLLDVGGGHGLYSVKYCRRTRGLSATIFDWPQGLAAAKKVIAEENMLDRITLREGDIWTDDFGQGFDVVLLFNIIHMCLPEKNKELFTKVKSALNPGGMVVILDQMAIPTSSPTAKATASLLGMVLFFEVGGQTYPPGDVAGWLTQTGFHNTRQVFLRKSPGIALVMGTKK
jgi:2-polyprenyl-3-methyl-5-hydroxy-6-metoxy-1,4-benzoquinol methylase